MRQWTVSTDALFMNMMMDMDGGLEVDKKLVSVKPCAYDLNCIDAILEKIQ